MADKKKTTKKKAPAGPLVEIRKQVAEARKPRKK